MTIRDDNCFVMDFLRQEPKGNVDSHVLRSHSRLRACPRHLAASNTLPSIFAGLKGRSSGDGKRLNANIFCRTVGIDKEVGIKTKVLKVNRETADGTNNQLFNVKDLRPDQRGKGLGNDSSRIDRRRTTAMDHVNKVSRLPANRANLGRVPSVCPEPSRSGKSPMQST